MVDNDTHGDQPRIAHVHTGRPQPRFLSRADREVGRREVRKALAILRTYGQAQRRSA